MDVFGNVIASEIEPGLTTQDLADATKEYMHVPKPSRDEVIRDYVYPLLNQGIINKSKSVINGKEIILSPAEEGKIFSMFAGENEKDSSLKLEINDTKLYPGKNVIEESYVFLSKRYSRGGVKNNEKKYLLVDPDGNEITVQELVDRYLNNPETCFRVNGSITEAEVRSIFLTEGMTPVRGYGYGYEKKYQNFSTHVCSIVFTEFSKKDIEENYVSLSKQYSNEGVKKSNLQNEPISSAISESPSNSSRIYRLWPGGD